MKKFNNDSFQIGGKKVDYKELIKTALDQTPQGGFSYEDIKERGRIDLAVEKANGVIELEDSDAENLKNIVKGARWAIRATEIEQFTETILGL